jgi:hypothetical protein
MTRTLATVLVATLLLWAANATRLRAADAGKTSGDFPEPSPYPVSWELKFDYGVPKRIVVAVPDQAPQAYWYLTYKVTNDTGQEQQFLPLFEMLTNDGKVVRSDRGIHPRVFSAIKEQEGNQFLERRAKVEGTLRQGEAQAKDSVAIWKEPLDEMGQFSIFITGVTGEAATYRMEGGKLLKINPENVTEETKGVPKEQLVTLRKTLKLDYVVYGDEKFADRDEVIVKGKSWVMR